MRLRNSPTVAASSFVADFLAQLLEVFYEIFALRAKRLGALV